MTPVSSVAAFLAGSRTPADGGRAVDVVQPPASKTIEVDVVVPVPDLADLRSAPAAAGDVDASQPRGAQAPGTQHQGVSGPATLAPGVPDLSGAAAGPRARPSVWPHIEERVVDLVAAHRSTLVFTNSRRGAERLTSRMNEVWAEREGAEHADPG